MSNSSRMTPGPWALKCPTNVSFMTVQDAEGRYIIYNFAHSKFQEGNKPILCPGTQEQRKNGIAIAQLPDMMSVIEDACQRLDAVSIVRSPKENLRFVKEVIRALRRQLAIAKGEDETIYDDPSAK